MARFNFRLQQFLGVKEQIEDQKELEYGKAIRKREEEKALLRQMEEQREQQLEDFRTAVTNAIDPVEIKHYNGSLERLKGRIKQQRERVAAAEAFAEKKRLELVEAMKERKALEIVRDNAREAFIKEEILAEQKQVDELISFKHKDSNRKGQVAN
jgi:flagellar FliJ protein